MEEFRGMHSQVFFQHECLTAIKGGNFTCTENRLPAGTSATVTPEEKRCSQQESIQEKKSHQHVLVHKKQGPELGNLAFYVSF